MIQSHLTRSMSRHLVRMKMDNFSRRRKKTLHIFIKSSNPTILTVCNYMF